MSILHINEVDWLMILEKANLKGSLTVEAAIIISIFIFIIGITMNMAIVLYQEIVSEHEEEKYEDLRCIDYFYSIQDIGEVVNDK